MSDLDIPPPPGRRSPIVRHASAHGWLRIRRLDRIDAEAWEMPDGTLRYVPRGLVPKIVTIEDGGQYAKWETP